MAFPQLRQLKHRWLTRICQPCVFGILWSCDVVRVEVLFCTSRTPKVRKQEKSAGMPQDKQARQFASRSAGRFVFVDGIGQACTIHAYFFAPPCSLPRGPVISGKFFFVELTKVADPASLTGTRSCKVCCKSCSQGQDCLNHWFGTLPGSVPQAQAAKLIFLTEHLGGCV